MQQAYSNTPVALATNILTSIYPQNDKYQNIQQDFKFFGSESLSTRFSETFSENYQQTEGLNFPNYESNNLGYQDLRGTVAFERKKKKKKSKR